MSDLKQQLKEDKALRSAARSIVSAQVEQVKLGLSGERMGKRLADKVSPTVFEGLENSGPAAKVIGGAVAGVAAIVAIALAWKPAKALLQSQNEPDDREEADDDA